MTTAMQPTGRIDERFSSEHAPATPWPDAREQLDRAEIYWCSTVRADGRPHVTPLIGVWLDEALHICTGAQEQKARNLEANPHVAVTTGTNAFAEGLDVIVEGDAVRVTDHDRLHRIADAYESKYGSDWRFDVHDGAFAHHEDSLRNDDPGRALVFAVVPTAVFAYARGAHYSQTRFEL